MTDTAPPEKPRRTSRWRRLRQRARRDPRALWYATASAAAIALYAVAAPLEAALYGVPVVAALALPAVQSAALVAAFRLPAIAIAAYTIAGLALRLWTPPTPLPWPWSVTAIIGFALLVGVVWARRGWRLGLAAYAAPVVSLWLPMALWPDHVTGASMIVALAIGGAAAIVGALLHERVRMSGQLAREREVSAAEVERRHVAEERQRIARELHDVVAHGLSLIQVQATSARYRLPEMDDAAAAEFDDIARSARDSMAEMRRLLGVLRGDGTAETAPQPSIEDLPRLVAETERAGAEISISFDAPSGVPSAVGIAAYRIVQEAISNAVRHSRNARIAVAVGAHDGALIVEVDNAAVAGPADVDEPRTRPAGHGLVGMRERAHLLGGSLQAGRTAAGGFRVAAVLPLDASAGGSGVDGRPSDVDPEAVDSGRLDGDERGGVEEWRA